MLGSNTELLSTVTPSTRFCRGRVLSLDSDAVIWLCIAALLRGAILRIENYVPRAQRRRDVPSLGEDGECGSHAKARRLKVVATQFPRGILSLTGGSGKGPRVLQTDREKPFLSQKSVFLFATIFETIQGCAGLPSAVCKRTSLALDVISVCTWKAA